VQPPKAAPPQVVPAKPRGVTRSQAVPEGGWGDVTLSADIDVTSLSSTSIVVHFTVDESGSPTNIHIVRSSGNADLDAQVKDLIKHKHYEPAMQDGVALSAEAEHTFSVD
jgi:TonB family protein